MKRTGRESALMEVFGAPFDSRSEQSFHRTRTKKRLPTVATTPVRHLSSVGRTTPTPRQMTSKSTREMVRLSVLSATAASASSGAGQHAGCPVEFITAYSANIARHSIAPTAITPSVDVWSHVEFRRCRTAIAPYKRKSTTYAQNSAK